MRIPLDDIPPGLNTDDTAFAASPAWVDGSNMRFSRGKPETIPGWESVVGDLLGGVCRSAFHWTDNANTLTVAFGTHQTLELYQGGALYDITPASGFTAGQIDGTGSTGYGTGAYGIGGYGSPSATDYFPLTWSHGAWGQKLLSSPRNQSLFEWSNNTAAPAAIIANAPDNITYMLVAPTRQVFALGCNEEVSGVFNPVCIRHSSIGDNTDWTTTSSSASTAREYILPGGGRIVAGRMVGRYMLIWTNQSLFLGTYVGQINKVWEFNRVGDKCGLIGPGAAVVLGSTAYWVSPDRQFHAYTLGGAVTSLPCPIRGDFADNLAASQGDKIVASSIAEHTEIRFDYPDSRDGYENSRYVAVAVEGPDAGAWYKGEMARTAMVDAGPSAYPIGTTYAGNIYFHEKGLTADGGAREWSIQTSDTALQEDLAFLLRQVWPDIADQVGPVNMTIYAKDYPQGDARTYGPYALAPGQDVQDIPGKASGRLFAVRLAGSSSPSHARVGRNTFDVKPRGRRSA